MSAFPVSLRVYILASDFLSLSLLLGHISDAQESLRTPRMVQQGHTLIGRMQHSPAGLMGSSPTPESTSAQGTRVAFT
jgi:hypothetical protein